MSYLLLVTVLFKTLNYNINKVVNI